MKYIFTLLLIAFTGFAFQAKAQNTNTCNPAFISQHLNGMTIKFTPALATDSPLVQHSWNFGDYAGSNQISPAHTFALPGVYHVKHTVTRHNPNGVSICMDSTMADVIAEGPCNLTANFSNQTNGQNPLMVYFAPSTTPNIQYSDSTIWTFGDGSSSTDFYPVHTYTSPGTYTVCLRVRLNNSVPGTVPCMATICRQVIVGGCDFQVYFSNTADTQNPALIHFTNQTPSYTPSDSTIWTFGDGSTSILNNPDHVFANPGTYNVCLIIKRHIPGATTYCVREYCKVVTITPPPCTLVASFTATHDSTGVNAANWHFTNTSAPLGTTDSIRWSFGDGAFSSQVSPNHFYTVAGTYNVCLRIIKRNANGTLTNCVSEVCHTVTVVLPTPCTLVAAFTVSHDSSGVNINNYHFTNTSTPLSTTDSIRWSFGDGTTSNQVSPNHVYTQPGTYTVCLLIIKRNANGTLTNCASDVCHTVTVVLPNTCNLTVGFASYRDSAAANLYTYHFTNLSSPLAASDSIRWTFGDGTSSNQVNPVHAYAQPGTYTVCLRVIKRNPNGVLTTCIRDTCKTLVVEQLCNIHPHYTWHADSVNYRKIYFTNTTSPINTNVTAIWSFGDGTTATSWNAIHEYAQAGTYYVCLRLTSGNCVTYSCDSIRVTAPAPPCRQLSIYHYTRAATDSQTYYFAPNYVSNDIQYTWTFGDGTGTQPGPNAVHHFATAGTYTVCLTAYKNQNCASTTCNTIQVHAQPNCSTSTIDYNFHRDSLVPNRITFTAYSNVPIVDQVWTITKLPATSGTGTATIHMNNPTYVFLDSGSYRVCLRATLANGCIKEYCNNIHIEHGMPGANACTLQAYPNPAGSEVHVSLTLVQPLMLYGYIYNSANVLMIQKQQQGVVGNNILTMNTANLAAGIYTIKVIYGNAACTTTFVKQ